MFGNFKLVNVVLMSLLAVLLTACSSAEKPGALRLGLQMSPDSLGHAISVQQHLKVERQGRIDEVDAALEIDHEKLDLVGLAFGQRVFSLNYNGKDFKSWRHFMLPAQVQVEDVLENIQLSLWPLEVLRQHLPSNWRVEDQALQRNLFLDDQLVMTISYTSMPRWSGVVKMENWKYRYTITIQTAAENEV
jgi:hypothetical protein